MVKYKSLQRSDAISTSSKHVKDFRAALNSLNSGVELAMVHEFRALSTAPGMTRLALGSSVIHSRDHKTSDIALASAVRVGGVGWLGSFNRTNVSYPPLHLRTEVK